MLAKRGRYIVRRAEAVSREGGARRHHARLGVRSGGSGAKVAARQWGCQGCEPESFRLNPALPGAVCDHIGACIATSAQAIWYHIIAPSGAEITVSLNSYASER